MIVSFMEHSEQCEMTTLRYNSTEIRHTNQLVQPTEVSSRNSAIHVDAINRMGFPSLHCGWGDIQFHQRQTRIFVE